MRITIQHQTRYDYSEFTQYAIQRIYLTPRDDAHSRVLRWEINGDGELSHRRDAFGNVMSTLVTTKPTQHVTIGVQGQVESMRSPYSSEGLHLFPQTYGELPVGVFLRPTSLTLATPEMTAFARAHISVESQPRDLIRLAEVIEDRLIYTPGATLVSTSAADAWQRDAGVCQDHAHVMLALCRSAGLPARYVSGYLSGDQKASDATHAWVDVWLDGVWQSVDVTHRCFTGERWLRLAVGHDYNAVSPIRGVRSGGGEETMQIEVSVQH